MMDSDGRVNAAHRSHIIDARRRGLYVKITDLQLDDTGLYWVGIDKIYADIMVSVNVVVTHGKKTAHIIITISVILNTC